MKETHPTIIVHYIPGGCTGVFQACDVGMQRIFKHSCKKSYHAYVVESILGQLKTKKEKETIKLDQKLGPLRDASVGWIWTAYETLNKPDIVKKVRLVANMEEQH